MSRASTARPETVVATVLFDDLGNQIESVLHRRSNRLKLASPVGLGDLVFSKPLILVHGMGHRRHVRGIDGIHPAHEVEDVGELPGGAGNRLVADLQAPGQGVVVADALIGFAAGEKQ